MNAIATCSVCGYHLGPVGNVPRKCPRCHAGERGVVRYWNTVGKSLAAELAYQPSPEGMLR